MRRWRIEVLVVFALGAGLVSAGCGRKQEPPGKAPPSPPAVDAVTPPAPAPPDVAPAPAVPPAPDVVAPGPDTAAAPPIANAGPSAPETPPAVPVAPVPAEPQAGPLPTATYTAGDLTVESIQLCTAIENRQCVGETRLFAPGQMVWALLRLSSTQPAARAILVSYVTEGSEPAAGRGLRLSVPAQARYTTFSKASKSGAGRYEVVVRTEQDEVLARATFEVSAAAVTP